MAKKTNVTAVKLTLQDLINKKLQKSVYEIKYENVYASKLEGEMVFRVPNESEMFDAMDELAEGTKMSHIKEVYTKMIYRQCEILHEKELLEAYSITRGFDIVEVLFSTKDIFEIGNKFMEKSEFNNKEEEIKN